MSMGSLPKTSSVACTTIGKAEEQPCTVTDDNSGQDCYESMHAFKKIRTSTSGLRKSPNKWTKEENQKLTALVSSYGEKKWKRISAEMGGQKTGAQCAQHWKRVLSPEIRKGHWDENEEDLLLRLVVQYGSCWKKIAKKIPQRTDIQCRYQYLKAKQSREVLWDTKEDESLIKKVMEMANCNFFQVLNDSHTVSDSTTTPFRNSSNYHTAAPTLHGTSTTSAPTNIGSDAPNKENRGSGSDNKDDERVKDAWHDDTKDSGNGHWRSGICANCHSPVGSHVSKIVWLEISEHMARLKLTSTLRTALECKTRFMDILGSKLSLSGLGSSASVSDFCLSSSSGSGSGSGSGSDSSTSAKTFGPGPGPSMKADFGGRGFGNTLGGGMDRVFHNGLGDANIGIKINNTNKINTASPTPNNGNNINLTNCNNNNITINITNSYTSANLSQNGVNFQQIAHNAHPVKMEHSPPIPPHLLTKTPIPPILSPAPPFPSFSTFPHLPQPASLKAASVRPMSMGMGVGMGVPHHSLSALTTSGLESLAAVASILPREMLAASDYAHHHRF